jgi:Na+/melibiose symporter-like transporter
MKNSSLFASLRDNSDGLAKSRRGVLGFNYLSGVITLLMTGTYFTGLMLEMGARDGYISAVTVAITICGFAQFFSPLLLERMKKRKLFLLIMRALYHLFNVVMIGVIPLLPLQRNATLSLFIAAVIAGNLVNALSLSGLSIWHIQNVPEHSRSDFFTLANVGVSLFNTAANFSVARMVDAFKSSGVSLFGIDSPMIAFLAIRAIALVMAAVELILLSTVKEHPYEKSTEHKIDLRSLFIPLRNREFMRVITIYIAYYFTSAVIGRYFQTYLLDVVKMSYTYQSLSSVCGLPIVLIMSPVWSRLLRKCSWEKVLPIAILGTAAGYFFNTLITSTTQYFHIACCATYSSFHVAVAIIFSFLPYEKMPNTDRTTYISFFTISGSIAGLLGNLFGMLFMNLFGRAEFTLFSLPITAYQLLNLVQTGFFVLIAIYSVFATKGKAVHEDHSEENTAA